MKRFVIVLMMALTAGTASAQKSKYDINKDSEVNVGDVTTLVNMILSSQLGPLGDINSDGSVDVVDVTLLVNYILGVRQINGHDYVDLGLPSGTLWATCNVGASKPEDAGDYFAWGELSPKTSYSWGNYLLCEGTEKTLNKYNGLQEYGQVDNLSTLLPDDDVAHQQWKGSWQIPTEEQTSELKSVCTWTLDSGRGGYVITGPNENSIFLPLTGYFKGSSVVLNGKSGYYWTSTLDVKTPRNAYCMLVDTSIFTLSSLRNAGRSIRPVAK